MSAYLHARADGVRFVRKDQSWLMRTAARFLGPQFMTDFWSTLRFPFCRATVYYPTTINHPGNPAYDSIVRHELHHVGQFDPWYGPVWCALLYCFQRGRWRMERGAYAINIRDGVHSPSSAARMLRRYYYIESPTEAEMVAWFVENAQ